MSNTNTPKPEPKFIVGDYVILLGDKYNKPERGIITGVRDFYSTSIVIGWLYNYTVVLDSGEKCILANSTTAIKDTQRIKHRDRMNKLKGLEDI